MGWGSWVKTNKFKHSHHEFFERVHGLQPFSSGHFAVFWRDMALRAVKKMLSVTYFWNSGLSALVSEIVRNVLFIIHYFCILAKPFSWLDCEGRGKVPISAHFSGRFNFENLCFGLSGKFTNLPDKCDTKSSDGPVHHRERRGDLHSDAEHRVSGVGMG